VTFADKWRGFASVTWRRHTLQAAAARTRRFRLIPGI